MDALIALHHPARRRLYEVLTTGGPASVGQLALQTGLAAGSVSHHLKALHKAGFIEPAAGLSRDTRQSWWRGLRRRLSWNVDAFAEGSAGREIAELAEQANFAHHTRATLAWMRTRGDLPDPWRTLGQATDNLVAATPQQFAQLAADVRALITEWDEACRADADAHPDTPRRPVRFIARIFPSDPAAP